MAIIATVFMYYVIGAAYLRLRPKAARERTRAAIEKEIKKDGTSHGTIGLTSFIVWTLWLLGALLALARYVLGVKPREPIVLDGPPSPGLPEHTCGAPIFNEEQCPACDVPPEPGTSVEAPEHVRMERLGEPPHTHPTTGPCSVCGDQQG